MTTRATDDPQRDPRFDAAWRSASSEEPPPALDAAILAAAHREAGAKPRSLSAQAAIQARRRWWPLAAAATVAVIAIGVVQRAGHDELVAPPGGSSVVSDMPAQPATSATDSKGRAAETLALTPQSPQPARADAQSPASGGRAKERAPRDSVAPQSLADAQPGSRADAERRVAPGASAPLQKKAETDVAEPAPAAQRLEAVAAAPNPAPDPFPAAKAQLDALAARRATGGAPVADLAPESPAPQRNEAGGGSAKFVAPQPPSAAPSMAPLVPPTRSAAPTPSPAAPKPNAASFGESGQVAAQAAARRSVAGNAAAGGAVGEAKTKDHAPLPVPDWIALIRRLRDEGNVVEAARELAAFRTAHADHEKLLPPDLRDWHPPEK
jgi:hypothetical protein